METMTVEAIAAIPVSSFAEADCTLALWATWPQLENAFRCMNAWGFTFITGFPWIKTCPSTMSLKRVMGFWTMGASEALLIGRRGKPKLKGERKRVLGLANEEQRILWAPSGERHSKKPMSVHQWLEQAVDGPYLELFARRKVPNWTCWGLDLGFRLSEKGVEPA